MNVIFVWKFIIKDKLVFIVNSGACSLCVYKSIKKERSTSDNRFFCYNVIAKYE